MQFRVPQFIEVEDKLFGPFTFKQFIYMLGSGALCFIIWTFIPIKILALVLITPIAALGIALTFVEYNGKPFLFTLEAAFNYFLSSRLYIWKKMPKKKESTEAASEDTALSSPTVFTPKLSGSKLKELSWGLDVYDENKNTNDEF
jgi:hypothetical protein